MCMIFFFSSRFFLFQLLGRVRIGNKGIYSVDFSNNGRRIAVAGNSDVIAIRDINPA